MFKQSHMMEWYTPAYDGQIIFHTTQEIIHIWS